MPFVRGHAGMWVNCFFVTRRSLSLSVFMNVTKMKLICLHNVKVYVFYPYIDSSPSIKCVEWMGGCVCVFLRTGLQYLLNLFFIYVNHTYSDHMMSNMCILTAISLELIPGQSILISVANPNIDDWMCIRAQNTQTHTDVFTRTHQLSAANSQSSIPWMGILRFASVHISTQYTQCRLHCVSCARAHTHTHNCGDESAPPRPKLFAYLASFRNGISFRTPIKISNVLLFRLVYLMGNIFSDGSGGWCCVVGSGLGLPCSDACVCVCFA